MPLVQPRSGFRLSGTEGFRYYQEVNYLKQVSLLITSLTCRFVMKKVNKEFAELMFTRTEGRMIEQLTVRLPHEIGKKQNSVGPLSYVGTGLFLGYIAAYNTECLSSEGGRIH